MPLITPPTVTVSSVRPWQSGAKRAIARISGPLVVGQTLFKKNGTWFCQTSPGADVIDGADPVYVGGHMYEISQALYDEIVAAGFAPSLFTGTYLDRYSEFYET